MHDNAALPLIGGAMSAIQALQELNDHFNNGHPYDAVCQQQFTALFTYLWHLTTHPPAKTPIWVFRDADGTLHSNAVDRGENSVRAREK